jgi:hypothetical protein
MDGDTVISGLTYKKISAGIYIGGIRENNKIVYFYPDTASQEYMIYDFNMSVGDSIIHPYGGASCSNDTVIIDLVDTTLFADGYHAVWYLNSGVQWIEGIGSIFNLIYSADVACVSGNYVLEYMEGDSIVKLNNPNPPPPPPPNCLAFYSTTYDSVLNSFNLTVPTPIIGMISSYLWDFGDGTTSTLASPSHYYPIDSLYNVCMYVVSTSGTTCSYCHVIGIDTSGNVVRDNGFFLNVNSTGISDELSENNVRLFPNPTTGQIKIEMTKEIQHAELSIYNITGQLVFKNIINNVNPVSVDLSGQEAGMYYLEIINENKAYRKKLIKQ